MVKSRPTQHRVLLILGLLLGASVASIAVPGASATSPRDRQAEIIAENSTNWTLVTVEGITQTFKIPSSALSPECGNQDLQLYRVVVDVVSYLPTCTTSFVSLYARIYDGTTFVGQTQLPYDPKKTGVQHVIGRFPEFPKQIILDANKTYTLRISTAQHDRRFLPWPTKTPTNNPQTQSPTTCPTSNPSFGAAPNQNTVYVGLDNSNPYARGRSSYGPQHDTVATLHYGVVTHVNVLSVIHDPKIEVVTYHDLIGTLEPPNTTKDYHGDRLHVVMKNYGWQDPVDLSSKTAKNLIEVSGGAVSIRVENLILDVWSPHIPMDLKWPPIAATPSPGTPTATPRPTRIFIQNFEQWDDNNWPAYPHIPTVRAFRYPEPASFDYNEMLNYQLSTHGNKTIKQLLNEGVFDEIWLFGEPTARWAEGAMAIPPGGYGLDINGAPPTVTGLNDSHPVMGFSYEVGPDGALHSYGHRAERLFASVAGGNLSVTCHVNRTEQNHFNHFIRIWGCYHDDRTSTPPPTIPYTYYGSIGPIHKSHNGPVPFINDYNAPDEPYAEATAKTDEKEWFDFPQFSGYHTREIGASEWKKTGYYSWWFNHLPRYAATYAPLTPTNTPDPAQTATPTPTGEGPGGGPYNNIWPYLAKPGCFDLTNPRDNRTPGP